MITIENVSVCGWDEAIRGMRNPMCSWDKSDKGDNDISLMKKLSSLGSDHAKFRRMIVVFADVTAPLYWWKEYDTYKVGTVANSCSTMHKIHDKKFTVDDFSHEHLFDLDRSFAVVTVGGDICYYSPDHFLKMTCDILNWYRELYLKTKDKDHWWQMIQLLPSSYNQRRTIMVNYEVLSNIYKARRNHKLDEWRIFCDWIRTLPNAKGIIYDYEKN